MCDFRVIGAKRGYGPDVAVDAFARVSHVASYSVTRAPIATWERVTEEKKYSVGYYENNCNSRG
eukprot:632255-Pyramimonas_sp.AAC.1